VIEQSTIRIATRSSSLALWQADHIRKLLSKNHLDCRFELIEISTSGDQNRTQSLGEIGGTGLFTKEVQKAVLDHRADLAVHSLKDLPTVPVDGLILAGVPRRAARYDSLVFSAEQRSKLKNKNESLDILNAGLCVGTSSPRRAAQVLSLCPQARVKDIRGNVETRLAKVETGEYDAIVLAVAGLRRLGFGTKIDYELHPPEFYPAVAQGALGIECRTDDKTMQTMLHGLTDAETLAEVTAERSLLFQLGAGCHAPVGVETIIANQMLTISAVVLSPNGTRRLFSQQTGSSENPEQIATRTADDLFRQGAETLLL